jgi:signal transduction histidine kinase
MGIEVINTKIKDAGTHFDLGNAIEFLDKVRNALRYSFNRQNQNGTSRKCYDRLVSIASRNDVLLFQHNVLKCYVGGFIFVDPDELDVVPLFGSSDRTQGDPGYPLRYTWSNPNARGNGPNGRGIYEKAIDGMFLSYRLAESISLQNEQRPFLPEHLVHLPVFYSSEEGGSENYLYNECIHSAEKTIRKASGCHYCPFGETIFFLYAWRYLVRIIWLHGPSATTFIDDVLFTTKAIHCEGSATRALWSKELWGNDNSREAKWVDYLHEHLFADEGWQTLSNALQETSSADAPWSRDWNALLIVEWLSDKKAKCGEAFIPLLRFAEFAANVSKNTELGTQLGRWKDRVESCEDDQFSIDALMEIDQLLKRVVCCYFGGGKKPINEFHLSATSLLKNLHSRSRFPVLPYFYWIAADGTSRTHLVIPVWTSSNETVPVRLPSLSLGINENGRKGDISETINTGVVGTAVLGVHPLLKMDWTWPEISTKSEAFHRIYLLKQYYELFASYVADEWFFERLRRRDRHMMLGLVSDAAHRITNPLDQIEEAVKERDFSEVSRNVGIINYYVTSLEERVFPDEPSITNVVELVSEEVEFFRKVYLINKPVDMLTFTNHAAKHPTVILRPNILRSVICELLYNAEKSLRQPPRIPPRIQVSVELQEATPNFAMKTRIAFSEASFICVNIEDNGHGISAVNREQIFKKGMSTRDGTGYGLWRARQALREELGGDLIECGEPGFGARFRLLLPLNTENKCG